MKAGFAAVFFAGLLAVSPVASAQDDEATVRIMLVHGVWASSIWEKAVRAELEQAVAEIPGHKFEFAEQFLGFYSYVDTAPIERFSTHIESLISEQQINFVVCVMPAACDFMAPLDIADAHLISVGARDETVDAFSERTNATGILTPAPNAIRETIEHIRALLGTDRQIHFLSGSGINDRRYARLAEQLVTQHYPEQEYTVHIALEQDTLSNAAAALMPGRDVGFVLATEAFGEDAESFPDGSMARMVAMADVPTFVFWDAAIGTGVVGGSTVSAAGYASRAAATIEQRLSGAQPPARIVSDTLAVYDATVAGRFGLDLARLEQPVRLLNRQPTLWETNPALVVTSIAVVILMLLIIVLLSVMLQFNRRTSRQLAQRERQARESEAKYRLVAETSADAIWTYEAQERRFSYCSSAIETITGFTVDEFLALPSDKVVPPKSAAKISEEVTNGSDAAVFEIEMFEKSGGTVPVEVSVQVFRDDDGAVERLVGITRNIRERKRREQEAEDVAEKRRQRQKMESLGTLAAGIAHDFNNVLGVITGLVDLQGVEIRDKPEALKLNREMYEASARAQRLVRRILTFTRPASENRAIVDLRRALSRTTRHLESTLPDGVDLRSALPDRDIVTTVRGDANQIEQAIINLVSNAIEAVPAAGGEVRVTLDTVQVEITEALEVGQLEPGEYARIRVADNGSGIPADKLERIFDPFFTGKSTGSGIGLAIVQGVVMEHSGAVRVQSTPGEGTVFELYLPSLDAGSYFAEMEPATDDAPQTADEEDKARVRVLLIDDQEELLTIVARLIRSLGHSCIACSKPELVSDILEEHAANLDVVISDYSMPGISGGQIIEMCRKNYPHLVTYLSTGYATADAEALARGKGADGVLPKPLTMYALSEALEEAVKSGRLRRAC